MVKNWIRGGRAFGTVVGITTLVIVLLIGGSAAIIPASDIAVFNITPTPTITVPRYTVSVSTLPSGLTPQPTGGGTYPEGQAITVTAKPVTGYTFQRWTVNGDPVPTDASYQFNVTGNRSLVAEYSQNQYNISVSTSPSGLNPQPAGEGTYFYNDTAKVIAQPVTGYIFQRWTENGKQVSTDAS